jgi:protein SCO1/2
MNKWVIGLLGLIALGVGPAVAQPSASGHSVRLDPPDVVLVDQTGAPHRFVHDLIEGKIAVVSFVFTGCSTICSPVGANMGALDEMLRHRVGAEVSLVSVTLDPFNDTPAQLAKWRAQFDSEPGWRLLTGDPDNVNRLLHAMRQDVADVTQHAAFLWVGDPRSGAWTRLSALAAPDTLAALIKHMEGE